MSKLYIKMTNTIKHRNYRHVSSRITSISDQHIDKSYLSDAARRLLIYLQTFSREFSVWQS